ncbi:MAG: VOC family protein [Clostridia bacterium]|nr:VOC family protein [Clostridia bacterium]
MIKGLMHVAFWVKDMEKMLDFYVRVLGMEKIFSMDNADGTPGTVYLRTPDQRYIELFHGASDRNPPGDGRTAGYSHLCLEVEDIRAAAAELEERGVVLRVRERHGRAGNIQCWIDDPDGNPIEIMQLKPDSPILKPPADGVFIPEDLKGKR